jgi:hypothetical protein
VQFIWLETARGPYRGLQAIVAHVEYVARVWSCPRHWSTPRNNKYRNVRRNERRDTQTRIQGSVSWASWRGTSSNTHARLDQLPPAPSLDLIGCWLMRMLIPNSTEGQARNRFLVIIMRPERNIPEVDIASGLTIVNVS